MTLNIIVSSMDKFSSDKTEITSEEFSTVYEANDYIKLLSNKNNLLLYSIMFRRYGEVIYKTQRYKNYKDTKNFIKSLLNTIPSDVYDDDVVVSLTKKLSEASDEFGNEFVFKFFGDFSYIPIRGSVKIIGHTTPGIGNKDKELGKFIKKNRHLMDEVSSKLGFNLLDIPEYLISDEGLGLFASKNGIANVIGNDIYTVVSTSK